MKQLLVAAALAAAPAVAFAQADDLAQGQRLRVEGRAAEAIAPLQRATAAHPDDADAWLNLGLAYSATHRFDDAERALDRAASLAPDYADVQIARARLAYFRGDTAQAESRLAPALAKEPQNAEALELRRSIAAAAREAGSPWRFDAGVSRAHLTRGLPDATDVNLALTRRLASGVSVTGSYEHVHQFGRSDDYGELVVGGAHGYLAVGGAPDAIFRPEWTVRGGLASTPRPIGAGWTVQVGAEAGWARYPVGDVRTLSPQLTLAKGESLQLQGRWINVVDERDEHRSGYALLGEWQAARRLRLSAGWADAPESSEGVTTKARAVSAGAAFEANDRTTVRLNLTHEDRPIYKRTELALGLTRRF